jgi:hypothetical protein
MSALESIADSERIGSACGAAKTVNLVENIILGLPFAGVK